ncbi:MAG: thioesterase family protein [Pseudomonadota bacterium]|nr:thioesterase family protein [Pseudomonadota bacterium]
MEDQTADFGPRGYGAVMSALVPAEESGAFAVELPDGWLQGRTTYGGMSAALCVEAARLALPGLPPLRSAQFAFAGPASGRLVARARLVRQGKSAATATAELDGDAGPAVRALLTYGAARDSAVAHRDLAAPDLPGPEDCGPFMGDGPRPRFAENFDMRLAAGSRLMSGGAPTYTLWVRHLAAEGADPLAALVALADAPPPPGLVLFTGPAPISTMTWSADLLAEPGDPGGWHLLRSDCRHAAGGYSEQAMTLWDAEGRPLMVSRQRVAIFA